eukprot:s1992_g5.t2
MAERVQATVRTHWHGFKSQNVKKETGYTMFMLHHGWLFQLGSAALMQRARLYCAADIQRAEMSKPFHPHSIQVPAVTRGNLGQNARNQEQEQQKQKMTAQAATAASKPRAMQTSMLPVASKETAGTDLEDATSIVKLLKAAGFSAATILELGHSAAALRLAGYDVSELRALGLDTKGLRQAGYSAKALQASGCTAPELKDAGYSPAELKDLGFTAYELRLLSFKAEQMRKSQFPAHQLLTGGYSSAELKEGGYTAQELLCAGRTPAELREMGTGVAELRKAGLGVKEIKEAGFTYVDMMMGGFCPDEVLLQVQIPHQEMGHAVAHLFSASGATAQSRHDVASGAALGGKGPWLGGRLHLRRAEIFCSERMAAQKLRGMMLFQEAYIQQPTYFRSFTRTAAMAAALQLVLVACAFQDGFADIDNIFPILYTSNPVARHTACPTPAGQATVCQLSGYEEGGRDLQYLITSLPSSGALYETSQNYRTYGTDPKYAATSIKDFELPFKVTDALGRVVYIPPSDVFPPEGRWAAMTYERQEPAGGNKSQPGQVSFSSPSQQVAASTFVGGTDAWTISGNIYATVPTWQAFGWGMLNRYLYGTDEVQYIDFDTNSDKSKWYFEAPPGKFYLPELAASYGGTLQFTIASTYGDFQHLNSPLDFITLECASCNSDRGMRLVRFADNGLEWTGEEKIVQVTLSTGNHWWRDPMNAALPFTDATECEIAAALGSARMPRPCRPEEVEKQNVLPPPDPTSELLESIQSVLRQQELQLQELLAEQTERLAGVVCSMLHQSDEPAPQVLEPAAVEAKVAPTFSISSVQESTFTDDTSQRKGTKSTSALSHRHMSRANTASVVVHAEQDVSLAKRLNGCMKTCCGSAGEAFAAVLILSNAILFGVQADHAVQQPSHEVPEFFRIAGMTFTVLFTLELLVRLRTEGRSMFSCHNPDIKWNVMDTVLVMLGILDEGIRMQCKIKGLLRLVRVARVLRVLRFFSDLRVMIMGVLSSLKALMWALILLFFIIYITAVCILQFVGEFLADNPQEIPSGPLEFAGLSPFSSLR